MDLFWNIYYFMYITTSVRFFLHNGVLASPLFKQSFKYKKSKKKILIQYPVCNEPIEFIHRFIKSLETIPKSERHRILLQICDDSKIPLPFKSLSPCVKMVYTRRWDDKKPHPFKLKNKASNMNYGLSKAPKTYEYVAVYDADHVMEGTGLIKAAEILEEEENTVCIQSRWVMLNIQNTGLSMLQEQIIGNHLEREQPFRSYWDLYPIFNGAGGLWKRSVLDKETNGKWAERTVCEDTDLSATVIMRGYKVKVLTSWITGMDNALSWKEYRKQQSRWIKANGQQVQYHVRDKNGWGLKKLYWLSWILGFFVAPSKYLILGVMFYKWYFNVEYNWLDLAGFIPHFFTCFSSCMDHENKFKVKGLLLYPIHFILEHAVLDKQIRAWWQGFLFYKKDFEFEVTNKRPK